MLKYIATVSENGPCVAYLRHDGTAVVVFETLSDATAQKMAAKLNFESVARAAMATRTTDQPQEKRRTVRYFEPDAFA